MADVNHTLVPVFKDHAIPNETASKLKGRPIVDSMEVVEIRMPGNRQTVAVYPAHENEPNATRESIARGGDPITYAMLYDKQYRQFKSATTQTVSGTPIEELPFLNAAKRSELKALNIHTAEALASLDGTPLKQLGMHGRELKMQSQAYLDKASGSADVTAQAARIAALEQRLREQEELIQNYAPKKAKNEYQRQVERSVSEQVEQEQRDAAEAAEADADETDDSASKGGTKALEDCSDAELKAFIKRETGSAIRGNPNRDTLMEVARAIASDEGK